MKPFHEMAGSTEPERAPAGEVQAAITSDAT